MAIDNSTAEYIQGLINNQQQLAKNLNQMGVSASASERFDGLIPKVLDIPTQVGITNNTWLPVSNTTEYTIENIPFIPAKIAMSCDDVLNRGNNMVVQGTNLVAIINVDFPLDSTQIVELTEKSYVIIENFTSNVVVTITQQSDGNYTVNMSLDELNLVSGTPYCFKGGYEHNWVITDKEWFSE